MWQRSWAQQHALSGRNIYRGSPRAFASDGQALRWAGELQDSGAAKQLSAPARLFSIVPYMHSEEPGMQVRVFAGLLTRPCESSESHASYISCGRLA